MRQTSTARARGFERDFRGIRKRIL